MYLLSINSIDEISGFQVLKFSLNDKIIELSKKISPIQIIDIVQTKSEKDALVKELTAIRIDIKTNSPISRVLENALEGKDYNYAVLS